LSPFRAPLHTRTMFALRAPNPARPVVARPAPARRGLAVVPRAEGAVVEAEPAAAVEDSADDFVSGPTARVLEKKRSRRFKEAKAKVRGV
jgi:hypothetical protein